LLNRDFKPRLPNSRIATNVPKYLGYLAISLIAVTLLVVFYYVSTNDNQDQVSSAQTSTTSVSIAIPASNTDQVTETDTNLTNLVKDTDVSAPPIVQTPTTVETSKWAKHTVKSGDSLAKIFSKFDLSASTLHNIIHSDKLAKSLKKIKPGQQLRVARDDFGEFSQLEYDIDRVQTIRISSNDNAYSSELIKKPIRTVQTTASAEINNSLYYDGKQAGLSDKTIMELANIFGWDIDFALNLRQGDSFTLLYEAQYINNERIEDGKILAAEFINRGTPFQAVRFTKKDGTGEYFSPNGKSMRKTFLRTPIEFARVSSHFNLRRKHPVLNRIRAHKGVDYAASSGTPIKATGDGRIIHRGVKGGYGRAVIIKHGQKYSTLYAHLSKYGRYKSGSFVKQGQVIGYVGKSGLATGPHLHYEFRMNGVHRNPLTAKFPAAKPIAKKLLAEFMQQTSPLLTALEQAKEIQLALK
jgi:murein DD-endopeptidase MepM/ murein hydrolase activator NlpD